MMMQLKKDWKEVEHPSGKYWYNKRTRETTRDMPLACAAPGVAIASLVAEQGEYCQDCHSTVLPTVRWTALETGRAATNNWLVKRCCPMCDGLLDYKTLAEPTTSTRAQPEVAASKEVAKAAPIARQESFARRLARKAVSSLSSEQKAKPAAPATEPAAPAPTAKPAAPAPTAKPAAADLVVGEAATSSTRAKRLSLKRARLDHQDPQSSAEMKSPRLSASDQIEMVVSTKVEGVASGATARFTFESEIV